MHVLVRQFKVGTGDLDPLDYGFSLENGHLLPSSGGKTVLWWRGGSGVVVEGNGVVVEGRYCYSGGGEVVVW